MPINKITSPSEVPASVSDYAAQNNLLEALLLASQGAQRIVAANVAKGAVFFVGGATYLADADTAISGSASDYVKLTPSVDGLTLAPSYVADLTGVTWSSAYNGYYDVSGNLYVFDELKAILATEISAASLRNVGVAGLGSGWATALATGLIYTAGSIPLIEKTSTFSTNSTSYVVDPAWRFFATRPGNISLDFGIHRHASYDYPTYGIVYKNGSSFGGENYTSSTTEVTFNVASIAVNTGDYIQVAIKTTGGTACLDRTIIRIGNVI